MSVLDVRDATYDELSARDAHRPRRAVASSLALRPRPRRQQRARVRAPCVFSHVSHSGGTAAATRARPRADERRATDEPEEA